MMKTKFIKTATILLVVIIVSAFTHKLFVFNGGTINNPFITVNPNAPAPPITATEASGCTGTITYQWQQSVSDTSNFKDIANANGINYQPQIIATTTYFRRKAICSGGGTAYTSNMATAVVVMPSQ